MAKAKKKKKAKKATPRFTDNKSKRNKITDEDLRDYYSRHPYGGSYWNNQN